MRKVYKTIEETNCKLEIYKPTRWLKIYYAVPEYCRKYKRKSVVGKGRMEEVIEKPEPQPYFVYKGFRYYLGDIMRMERESEFEGYHNDTYFSGFYVKMRYDDDSEPQVKVYEYCSVG